MEKASGLFEALIRELHLSGDLALARIRSRWYELFPPPLGLNMAPDRYAEGKLHLKVSSHVWLQQLYFYREKILEKLKPHGVKAVKLAVGPLSTDGLGGNEAKAVGIIVELKEEDILFIEETTVQIGDAELREAIKRAMATSLSFKRYR